ncbi:UNVERIFIED_CONTAM: hypothetical protein FKN15_010954 [Acipenser sinensis]
MFYSDKNITISNEKEVKERESTPNANKPTHHSGQVRPAAPIENRDTAVPSPEEESVAGSLDSGDTDRPGPEEDIVLLTRRKDNSLADDYTESRSHTTGSGQVQPAAPINNRDTAVPSPEEESVAGSLDSGDTDRPGPEEDIVLLTRRKDNSLADDCTDSRSHTTDSACPSFIGCRSFSLATALVYNPGSLKEKTTTNHEVASVALTGSMEKEGDLPVSDGFIPTVGGTECVIPGWGFWQL